VLLVPTLRSIARAKERAIEAGYSLEVIAIADNADQETLTIAEGFSAVIDRIIPAEFGDLGASREFGIAQASFDWVFLHDGDDLFSSNWFLQFFEMAARGEIDERTVYHTSIFARFGNEQNVRQMIDSADPRFHPLFLASEWYYSNKSVLNRKLFDEIPMPYNNKRTGIGNEDWTWSCHTIQQGIRHSYLPETICFYRVKPAITSLGLTPGMIHDASPLFAPENILALETQRAKQPEKPRAFADTIVRKGEPVLGDGNPPGWFWDEVETQGEFESLITDFRAFKPGALRALLPNLHYNVVSATQYFMQGMDERPKIFIFATEKNLRAADKMIELILQAASDYNGQSHQPVLIVDEGELVLSELGLRERFGAKLICTNHVEQYFKTEDWYFNRLMMRPIVQYQGAIILDLGSDIFNQLFTEFHRVLLENYTQTISLLTDARFDVLSPAMHNVAQNAGFAKAHAGKTYKVVARPDLIEKLHASTDWALAELPEQVEQAFNDITRFRYRELSGNPEVSLEEILAAPERLCAESAPMHLPADTHLSVKTESEHSISVSTITYEHKRFFLYQSTDTWIAPEWYHEAHGFLRNNEHIWLVPPQISLSRKENGEYRSRWHNYSEAKWVFSGWYDQLSAGEIPPLVVMTRERLSKRHPKTALETARLLYNYCKQPEKMVSTCNETLAVAMPSQSDGEKQ